MCLKQQICCPCCPELSCVAELCNVNYLALNYTTSYKDKLIVFTYFEPYARHFVPQFVNLNAGNEKHGMQPKKREINLFIIAIYKSN